MNKIINTKNLKLDFQNPDFKAYGKNMPIVNKKVMQLGALKRQAKDKMIDVTSDILSAPKRAYYDSKSRASDAEYKTYKMVNDAKGVKDKGNESDPLFRARNMMQSAKKKALDALMRD